VRLPDGSQGYVAARLTEPVDEPVTSVAYRESVRARPTSEAPILARLDEGTELPVLGRFDGFLYVRTPGGTVGWMPELAQQP
jgi:hypothetical protein